MISAEQVEKGKEEDTRVDRKQAGVATERRPQQEKWGKRAEMDHTGGRECWGRPAGFAN